MGIQQIKGVSLTSSGGKGQSYTEAEKLLALIISRVVLTATSYRDYNSLVENEEEIITTLRQLVATKGISDVPGLCRGVYKKIEAIRLTDSMTVDDFPKRDVNGERSPRDFTSYNLLFRNAFIQHCSFSREEVHEIFPSYSQRKKKLG